MAELRLVLDTNVLVAGLYARKSASRQIIDGCLAGRFRPVLSTPLDREYGYILPRAVQGEDWQAVVEQLHQRAEWFEPQEVQPAVLADPDDDKLVALAISAQVDVLITLDHHLLTLNGTTSVPIMRPADFMKCDNPPAA